MFLSGRKKYLKKSDFGRINGWYVELGKERIAELVNPELRDQFWYAYDLLIYQNAKNKDLRCQIFWDNENIRFLSK